jgi:hypothetical protein
MHRQVVGSFKCSLETAKVLQIVVRSCRWSERESLLNVIKEQGRYLVDAQPIGSTLSLYLYSVKPSNPVSFSFILIRISRAGSWKHCPSCLALGSRRRLKLSKQQFIIHFSNIGHHPAIVKSIHSTSKRQQGQ